MTVYRRSFSDPLLPRMDTLFHRRTQSIPVCAHAACRFSHVLLSVRCYPASESSGGNCGTDFRSHIYHIILPIFRQVEGTRQIIERSTTIGGYRMKKLAIYVHGIGGNAGEAEHYRPLLSGFGYDVVGFDYRAQNPWEAREEFPPFLESEKSGFDSILLIANSIGAYFAMSSLSALHIDRALFISPVADMEKLRYDESGECHGGRAARPRGDSDRIRRNAVMGLPLLFARSSDQMERSEPHFIRRARQSDLLRKDLLFCAAHRSTAHSHEGRRALVSHGGANGIRGQTA